MRCVRLRWWDWWSWPFWRLAERYVYGPTEEKLRAAIEWEMAVD